MFDRDFPIARTAGEISIAFEHGPLADRPLVLMLHGVGADRRMWRPQLAALGDSFDGVAWDARGYGASRGLTAPFVFSEIADDAARLLDHLGRDRAHLVGQSMGGLVMQEVIARHPDRVASLTFTNATPSVAGVMPADRIEAFIAARREPIEAGVPMAELAAQLAPTLLDGREAPEAQRALITMMSELDPKHYIESVAAALRFVPSGRLQDVAVPTLVIAGERDTATPPEAGRAIADAIPGARFLLLSGAGHMANMEKPDLFNAALLDFLTRTTH